MPPVLNRALSFGHDNTGKNIRVQKTLNEETKLLHLKHVTNIGA